MVTRLKHFITILCTIAICASLTFTQTVFSDTGLSFISSEKQEDVVIRSCSDKQYQYMSSQVSAYSDEEQAVRAQIEQLKSDDKETVNAIEKTKKKIKKKSKKKKKQKGKAAKKKKKLKRKLKRLREKHKGDTAKITELENKLKEVQKHKRNAKRKLKRIKEKRPFTRISGKVDGRYIDNLINYAVLPADSIQHIEVQSGTWNPNGYEGELRGRKTVKEYVRDAAAETDEVIAVNGQGWGGPWATEDCQYDIEERKWYVPDTEKVGGWQFSVENPNYENDLQTNPKARKTIGTLPYEKKYAGFRIMLSGMMKKDGEVIIGGTSSCHEDWISFSDDGSAAYGSNKDGELPPDDHPSAVSGARIISDGEITEHRWASGGPKTLIGTRPNGDIVLVSTVGRMDKFYSFTPREHCEIMNYLGCDNAICMDGGGSTSMVYKFRNSETIVNIATCGYKKTNRPVANAILFYMK